MSRSAWNFEYSKPSSDAAACRATSPIAQTHEVVVPPCQDVKLGCMLAGRRACQYSSVSQPYIATTDK